MFCYGHDRASGRSTGRHEEDTSMSVWNKIASARFARLAVMSVPIVWSALAAPSTVLPHRGNNESGGSVEDAQILLGARSLCRDALRRATGVWLEGGRHWRLADAYLGTRTLQELFHVLDRGGVIGGGSAGATIQGSYMVRGSSISTSMPADARTIWPRS
jgi:hypothetical protein